MSIQRNERVRTPPPRSSRALSPTDVDISPSIPDGIASKRSMFSVELLQHLAVVRMSEPQKVDTDSHRSRGFAPHNEKTGLDTTRDRNCKYIYEAFGEMGLEVIYSTKIRTMLIFLYLLGLELYQTG